MVMSLVPYRVIEASQWGPLRGLTDYCINKQNINFEDAVILNNHLNKQER